MNDSMYFYRIVKTLTQIYSTNEGKIKDSYGIRDI